MINMYLFPFIFVYLYTGTPARFIFPRRMGDAFFSSSYGKAFLFRVKHFVLKNWRINFVCDYVCMNL